MKALIPHILRLLVSVVLFGIVHSAFAQTSEYWDPAFTGGTNGGGTGTWSTATNWFNGTNDVAWTNNGIAIFGGTAGTVTLSAAETANGLTFNTSNYTVSGSSTLTLAGTPTITIPAGTNTIGCPVAGTVPVTITGPGLLEMTHANTSLTGGMTINSGSTLAITSVTGAGANTATVTNNGTLDLLATGAANYAFPLAGSGTVNLTMSYNTASENLRLNGSVWANFSGTANLIAGLSSSNTPGAGQLILTNFQGSGITWNVGSGATLLLNPTPVGTTFPASLVILNAPGNSQPYGALRLDACPLLANVLLNGSGITIGDDNSGIPSSITGVISDGGNHYGFISVVVSGKTLVLEGANTYTGPTIIGGNGETGTLQLASAETPGISGPLGASATNNPGSIVFGGGTLEYSATNTFDYSGRFSTNAGQTYAINVNGQSVTFASPLKSSGGALTLSDSAGGGTLTLSAANTYSGLTTINSGTLNLSGSLAGTLITVNGGTLQLDNSTAMPSATILTLPASPAAGMVNLNFSGTQNITTLNFGASPMPSGTYGSLSNTNVLYQNAAFVGNGILNVEPPTYWDPGFLAASPGSGGTGSWDSTSTNWFIGSSDTKWVSNNVANFAGNAGTVTLNANETSDGLTFLTGGYDITNNGSAVLTLAGTPAINITSGTAEIDCPLAGTAGFIEGGAGTLLLNGADTFTGPLTIGNGCLLLLNGVNAFAGATTIGGGSGLTVGNSGNMAGGSYPGAIANSGTITYNSTVNQTLSGLISGSGNLVQEGPGALALGGYNTFSGSIYIAGGSLTISGTGDLGNNPTFNVGGFSAGINDNGAFIYDSSSAQTLSGQISGQGSLTQSGSGLLSLSGANTYTGVTSISSNSSLTISSSGYLGSGDYETNIVNDGTFTYDSSFQQTLSGVISGTGALVQDGAGTLTLTATNTYTGGTGVGSGSQLVIGDPGLLGNGAYAANITNSGSFSYNSSVPQTLSGVISGGGMLIQEGSGTLTLTGSNSFTGSTTISTGDILVIGGSGDLGKGSYAGIINNGGTFIYNSSASQTLSGAIGDSGSSGSVTQNGPGRLTLSGESSYSGPTTIGTGDVLIIGGSGSLGIGTYGADITNAGVFVYDSSAAQTLSGVVSGSGALAMVSTNTLSLTGVNTYTGATVISNGTLFVSGSGSIATSTSVSIAAPGILDVSALSSPYVFTSTNLSASGSATAAAAINGASGGVVNVGTEPISLTFTPQTFTGDATHPALNISQGSLTFNGNAVSVNNAGASPLGAGTYTLIQVVGGTISGAPGATISSVGGSGLAAGGSASISVSGGNVNLVVVVTSVPSPTINRFSISGGNLVFSGTNGPANGTYVVLKTTNVALPFSSWTPVSTNTFSGTGTFSATNAISGGKGFYAIEIP